MDGGKRPNILSPSEFAETPSQPHGPKSPSRRARARARKRPAGDQTRLTRALWLPILAWLCSASLAACGAGVQVRATVLEPAAVPVRAFPEIWVTGGHLEADERVLARLVEQLEAGGSHRVRRVELDGLEAQRLAGRIPVTAVVVWVEVGFEESVRQSWETVPVQVCGPFGCQTQYQQVTTHVPWLRGRAQLTVYEGPTARLLQQHVVQSEAQGRDPFDMRRAVAVQLAEQVAEAVEVNARELEVTLLELDVPDIERALSLIQAGDWSGGRALLEAAARSDWVRKLAAEDRARVFYDLGLARRFAPEDGNSERAFDAAARALGQAKRLDPQQPLYGQALAALTAHREAQQRLHAQREAARHNFALGDRADVLPQPPANYLTPP